MPHLNSKFPVQLVCIIDTSLILCRILYNSEYEKVPHSKKVPEYKKRQDARASDLTNTL